MTAESLDQAWARVASGDQDAFDDVLARTHRALRVSIAARLPNADLVEEVLQQTYVTAYEQRHATIETGKVLAWLRGIARNMTARCWRDIQRGQIHIDALERLAMGSEAAPEHDLESAEQAARLREALTSCLERLPQRSRKVLLAAYDEGQSQKSLAKRFAIKATAVKRLLFKTRGQLRDCLDSHGVPSP